MKDSIEKIIANVIHPSIAEEEIDQLLSIFDTKLKEIRDEIDKLNKHTVFKGEDEDYRYLYVKAVEQKEVESIINKHIRREA